MAAALEDARRSSPDRPDRIVHRIEVLDPHPSARMAPTASPTMSREERVEARRTRIFPLYENNQQAFLRFILERYVDSGIHALDDQVLPELIELKYGTPHDAQKELGAMKAIRDLFIGFQKLLYEGDAA